MKLTTMTMAAMTVGVFALVPITGATGNAETPLPMTAAAAAAPQDDDHADEAKDAHGDDDHAGEAKDAHGDDDHAGEAKDAHGDDDHAGEAKDAHGDDDHAGEAKDAHGDDDHAGEAKDAHGDDDHAGEAKDAHGDDGHAGEAKDAHGDDDHAGEAKDAHGDDDHAGEAKDAHGDDDHAGEAKDAHGDDDHAGEAKDAHGDDDHAGEAKDAHGDDGHAGEAKDAHGDDDHAGEAEGAHGDEGGGDVVKLTPEVAKEAGILLEQAELGALGESLSLPAEIRFDADRMANVTPKVSGVIDRLLVGEGDTVAYGDTLALITSRELAGLKAKWMISKTNEALAAQSLTRLEGLWAQKITSEVNVQTARAEHESAKTESEAAETELHAVGIDHADLDKIATAPDGNNANAYLTAPLAGTIVRRAATLGETVTAGDSSAKVLFTIVDDSVVWADIAVYKQDISRVRIGAPVALKSDAGDVIAQSTVAFVLPVIDEVSRTATARVIIDNSDRTLTPGQFVIADLSVGNAAEVLRVPQSAVQLVENRPSVFVPVDGGFAPRAVMVGTTAGGYVEIRTGLEEGDLFVSDGAFTLKAQLEKDAFGDGHGH